MPDFRMGQASELIEVILAQPTAAFSDNEIVAARIGRLYGCNPFSSKFNLALNSARAFTEESLSRVAGSKVDWGEKLPVVSALTTLGNTLDYPGILQPIQTVRSQISADAANSVKAFSEAIPGGVLPIGITDEDASEIDAALLDIHSHLEDDVSNEELKNTLRELLTVVEYGIRNHQRISPDVLRSQLLALLATIAAVAPQAEVPVKKHRWKKAAQAVTFALGALTFSASTAEQTDKLLKNAVDIIGKVEKVEQLSVKMIEDHTVRQSEGDSQAN